MGRSNRPSSSTGSAMRTSDEFEYNFSPRPSSLDEGRIENQEGEVVWSDPELRGADLLIAASESGTDLRGGVVDGVDLSSSNLDGLNLEGMIIKNSSFRGASMQNIRIGSNTIFIDNILQEADLTNLEASKGALMDGCDIRGASLDSANLPGIQFANMEFEDTSLRGANLQGGAMYECRVHDYDGFQGANMEGFLLEDMTTSDADPERFKKAGAIGAPSFAPEPDRINEELFPRWLHDRAKLLAGRITGDSWEDLSDEGKQQFLQEESHYMTPEERDRYAAGLLPET